jgi:tRNA A-37 threonylcarbamoyl transferase component Bud32
MNATFAPRFRLGPYELLLSFASGGMASVILARQHGAGGFERLVVVKRVHRRHLDNKDFTHMFRDEARLASSIRHSNVASVVDVIENEGELCLVMEYFESLSLSALVEAANRAERRLSPAVASRILSDTLVGLHAAHEAVDIRRNRLGIVHRDVSPQNIIVDVGGVSRVIDFGIAKAETRITTTKSGFVKGKLGYMSPEQIEAVPVDRRSDLFSVGIVLHETLTGKRLFSGDDEFETMRRVLRGEITDASKDAPGVSPELDAVIRKALARSPADRFQTGIAFQEALERAVPPAPAHEVGALVAELGKETLDQRHAELLAMLGEEFEKLSPRSPPRAPAAASAAPAHAHAATVVDVALRFAVDPPNTRGNTLPLRPVEAKAPADALPTTHSAFGTDLGGGASIPLGTLKSAEEAPLEGASSGLPSRGSAVSLGLVAVVALGLGLVVTFFAIRPNGPIGPSEATSSLATATATAPSVPSVASSAPATLPSAPLDAASPIPNLTAEPVAPSHPAPPKPQSAPSQPRPKPTAKPLLQPNPYDDPK